MVTATWLSNSRRKKLELIPGWLKGRRYRNARSDSPGLPENPDHLKNFFGPDFFQISAYNYD
jgi:hypothetical protein